MSIYKNKIITDLKDLNEAMFDKMSSITGIDDLVFKGFGSGRTTPPIPQVGMKIAIADFQEDRKRPGPSDANRVEVDSGTPSDYEVDGEIIEDVYPEKNFYYPLPLSITYSIHCWSHSATTQLQMDQKLLQKFPNRGVLQLEIDDEVSEFPIELVSIQTLDDLNLNIRERVYMYKLDCYVDGAIASTTAKIITKIINEYYVGNSEGYELVDEIEFEATED